MNASALRLSPRSMLWLRFAVAALLVGAMLLPLAGTARGASVTIEARALVAGNVRPGSWAAVRVLVANDGPSLSGELRIRSSQQSRSQYGVAVELPSGARQEHLLYAQPPVFGSRLHVDFVSEGQPIQTVEVAIKTHSAWSPTIAIVAERPEGIQAGIADAARNPQMEAPSVIVLTAADLPPRVEAWAVIDRLVWQDVDAASLEPDQLEALRLWVSAGGRLVVVGGTAGIGPLRGFPDDLLPFRPTQTVHVARADLGPLVGAGSGTGADVAAFSGQLREGTVLARSTAGDVIAAHDSVGQGTVTLVGINPAERWLADGGSDRSLWRRLLPTAGGPAVNPLSIIDDSMLVGALNNLPEIELPPIGQLFLLLFAYVALIGPVNYLVLRRLDRREWAWVTMPLLVGIFTVVSYGLGATIKGSDVIVNQLAIVRAGEDTGEGIGQVYVGVFSPSRRTFEVRVPGGALLANPTSQFQFGQAEQPLDVLFGDPSRLRNFEVGFGVLRGFRAEAPAPAPTIRADLRLVRGTLQGTVTNESDMTLEHVAIAYGGGAALLSDVAAGETRSVSIETAGSAFFQRSLSERIFGSTFPRDPAQARLTNTRRAVLDQLTAYGPGLAGTAQDQPVLLGWQRGPTLAVELTGERPNHVGDTLFVVPLSMTVDSQAVFNDSTITKVVTDNSSAGWGDGNGFYMGRGAMTVEARPTSFAGNLRVTSLELALSQGEVRSLAGRGETIAPLPAEQQPDQDDPLGEPPDPLVQPRWEDPPSLQLFDFSGQRWLEFEPLRTTTSYLIAEPQRFVDASGRVLARFVNRGGVNEEKWFSFAMRIEGTIE